MIEEEKLGSRRIHFPADRSLGVVSIRDWGAPGYGGWRTLGEAQGSLSIPAGREVMLKLHWSASTDLRPLDRLNPNDLQWLDCRDSQVADDQTIHLRGLDQLHDLGLGHTAIGDATLRHLANFRQIRELYLPGTRITDAGLETVGKLDTLRALALNDTAVTDLGARHLAGLSRLRRLWLKNTRLTDAGLEALSAIKTLGRIDLRGVPVTAEGLAVFAAALPDCYIVR